MTFRCHECFNNLMFPEEFIKDSFEGEVLNKYMSLKYFLSSYLQKNIYLSDPHSWEDPLEVKYIDNIAEYCTDKKLVGSEVLPSTERVKLSGLYVHGTCFTYSLSENEEASWKVYGITSDDMIRITFDIPKLLDALNRSGQTFYLSGMRYMPRNKILAPLEIKEKNRVSAEDLYINNFLLKQTAYSYEHEIRLSCLSENKTSNSNEYDGKIVPNVDLTLGAISHITLPPLRAKHYIDDNISNFIKYRTLKSINKDFTIDESTLFCKDATEESRPYDDTFIRRFLGGDNTIISK